MLKYTVNHLDAPAMEAARARWNGVAKPLNALGRLEDLIVQTAGIQAAADVRLRPRCGLIFCADHGVVAQGISQTDQRVTALVARAIADGTSNVNRMAAVSGTPVYAVDVGMALDVAHPALIRRRVARGTADLSAGPAMTRAQAVQAVQAGIDAVREMASRGHRLVAVGEMGIGNTTATAALCCALLGMRVEAAVDRGAGLSDAGLARKREVVRRALEINQPDPDDPLDALSKVGGLEIAAMAGAFLGGMSCRVPVVMDGVISGAAALIACRLEPACREFILPSHMGRALPAARIMDELKLSPVIHADLALGEGTGAVALLPLMDMACSVYAGAHTFEMLGMDAYTERGGSV